MATLNGKITIERELRPCIVHIPEKREYFRENRERKYRVKESSKDDVFKLLNDDNFSQFSLIVKEFIIWYFYKNKLFG